MNGAEKPFLLDTGGAATLIDYKLSQELKLSYRDSRVKMLDLSGNALALVAVVPTLQLGRLQETNAELQVMPSDLSGTGLFLAFWRPTIWRVTTSSWILAVAS